MSLAMTVSRSSLALDDAAKSSEAEATYRIAEVAKLFDIPESRLRYWSQSGFIRPSGAGRRGGYRFTDLISVKVAKGLLDAGIPLQRVRRSLDSLRMRLPQVDDPLAALRIRCDHDRVVVDDRAGAFDADTGQLLLDFDVQLLRDEAAKVLALPARGSRGAGVEAPEDPQALFVRARALDAERREGSVGEDALEEIEALYRRVLELDDAFAAAWTNLGSLLAEGDRLDEARDAFDEALALDPEQPEAQLNLAELALREGDFEVAIAGFRRVLTAGPEHLEAHYGLARALLEVGGRGQAIAHLTRFCDGMAASAHERRDADLELRVEAARAVLSELVQRAKRE